MSKTYLAVSYLIGLAFLAGMGWLAWDWHWAIKLPLLAYLTLATMVFPLARLPADAVVHSAALWSPVEIYGVIVWLVLAVFYFVVWALAVLFAPIGAIMRFAARKAQAANAPTGEQL
ncbi:hypothetical protein [Devosia ginsengisoli]|uniref:Uncharacterized protein n=1 Tax=Devosia ginsengisoli TaxID=400770 RepID=A0A5B8LTC7_9HYPH|nr:hypothetical protein [Devosia ginsengisoli]QDZ11473.1 hypothetical protein FPZ08_12285 [Devosia ginsengisoli]